MTLLYLDNTEVEYSVVKYKIVSGSFLVVIVLKVLCIRLLLDPLLFLVCALCSIFLHRSIFKDRLRSCETTRYFDFSEFSQCLLILHLYFVFLLYFADYMYNMYITMFPFCWVLISYSHIKLTFFFFCHLGINA